MTYLTKSPRGYTLLELIVAVGLFSMVMMIVMGVYLALISYDRQARATNQLVANLSFAVESMSRNIRTGRDYEPAGVRNLFVFKDASGTSVRYIRRSDGTIGQCTGSDALSASACTARAIPLTDPRITINTLRFNTRGIAPDDGIQPFVVISVEGTMKTDAGKAIDFAIQTTAVQRVLDIP
ncbi:MAG: type II secretion system protein [Patescibacteria group bacterium]